MAKLSTALRTLGLLGLLALPAGARTSFDVGPLNGKWEVVMKSVEQTSDGAKPTKSSFVFIGTMSDCASSPSAALCLEFKDSVGGDVSLSGSRYGGVFFMKSSDGNFVLSGKAFQLKNGLAQKMSGVGSRMSGESIDSLKIFGKRIGD